MSSYLGIEPTERADYFFASYCNEDSERLTPLVRALAHNNVPLWYDYGLAYGSQWQTQIADRIQGCQAVLLFISKNLFRKPQSYVTTEYEMATEYFDKTVYAIHIEDISKGDIPNAYLGWWINVTQNQSLIVSQYPSEERLMGEFARMLRISNPQERISTTMEQYRHLLSIGDSDKAQAILRSVLHEQMIETKAHIVANLFGNGYAGVKAVNTGDAFKTLTQLKLCEIGGMSFRAPYRTVFHRIGAGDADVIDVFRNDERVFTIGGLVDAYDGALLYDKNDDLLFVLYYSCPNVPNHSEEANDRYLSVCVIEQPATQAVCRDYRHPHLREFEPASKRPVS